MSTVVAGLVSIVTPTHDRVGFLRRLKLLIAAQTYPNVEWLILDDSACPNQEIASEARFRIVYEHTLERLSIGEKRNRLIDRARGEFIVQFDDDDYYGPTYVTTIISAMNSSSADLLNLKGWFLLDFRSGFFGYWDLMQKTGPHFCCDANGTSSMNFDDAMAKFLVDNEFGYGFSYAFRRAVWDRYKFAHIDLGEDSDFFIQARRSFKSVSLYDGVGLCLHTLHKASTSRCFPQYRLPSFMLRKLFPESALSTS